MKKKDVKEVKAVEKTEDPVAERISRLEHLVERVILKLNQVPQCGERI